MNKVVVFAFLSVVSSACGIPEDFCGVFNLLNCDIKGFSIDARVQIINIDQDGVINVVGETFPDRIPPSILPCDVVLFRFIDDMWARNVKCEVDGHNVSFDNSPVLFHFDDFSVTMEYWRNRCHYNFVLCPPVLKRLFSSVAVSFLFMPQISSSRLAQTQLRWMYERSDSDEASCRCIVL
jgi:hypothetical protein